MNYKEPHVELWISGHQVMHDTRHYQISKQEQMHAVVWLHYSWIWGINKANWRPHGFSILLVGTLWCDAVWRAGQCFQGTHKHSDMLLMSIWTTQTLTGLRHSLPLCSAERSQGLVLSCIHCLGSLHFLGSESYSLSVYKHLDCFLCKSMCIIC